MAIVDTVTRILDAITRGGELRRVAAENAELRERERAAIAYVRCKVKELQMVTGSLPHDIEELDDHGLLELDPIGIVADSFTKLLAQLHETGDRLREAREEIQAILLAAGVGILVVDNRMRIETCNSKAKELFSRGETEIIGQPCHKLLCHRDAPPDDCTFERVMATRQAIRRCDWVFDGRHYEVAGAPLHNRSGEITRVVLVYHDITERKQTTDALRESEEMYRSLLENAHDMFQSVAPDGTFREVNRAWREALGYGDEELARLTFLDIIHPEERDHCRDFFQRLLESRSSTRIETVFVTRDGRPLRVTGNVGCVFIDGKPTATCGIFRPLAEPARVVLVPDHP